MKRSFFFFTALMLLGSTVTPPAVFGQSTSSNAANIQSLLQTIANLQQQIQSLKDQMTKVQQQQKETVASLLTTLKQGDQGDNVKTLQALLAANPEIYPEGLISGYYGGLTAAAVKRFQKINGIEQLGLVGPKTLKKLNEFFNQNPVKFELEDDDHSNSSSLSGKKDDDDDDDKKSDSKNKKTRVCAIVPPGHLIAPGWLKKHDGVRPIVPICQILPPGIIPKLPPAPTSTTDTTAPILSSITVSPNSTSGIVSWVTNEAANSQISYGTSTSYGLTTVLDSALTTSHSQTLTGLNPSTPYHFRIMSRDTAGNLVTSVDYLFTTTAQPVSDTNPPIVSSIVSLPSSTSAVITWLTNETSDSQIFYGTSSGYGSSTTLNSSLVTSHSQTLTGLTASTTYHFQIRSKDASNNLATSTDQTFNTLPPPADTLAPQLSAILVAPSSTSALVTWTTNEPANSKVYYSTVTPLSISATSTLSQSDAAFVTSHSISLASLNATTTYYFLVESADASSNATSSSEQSFVTNP